MQVITLVDQHTDEKTANQNAEVIMRKKVRDLKF
jgi:hypothetical protein